MTSGHIVRTADKAEFAAPTGWAGKGAGLSRWSIVDETTEAVHTGFGICRLGPGGSIPAHVHSYEESFYVQTGAVVLTTDRGAVGLGPGDYGLVPLGVPHAWRNEGSEPAEWADMLAPQPRSRFDDDTFLVPDLPAAPASPVDVRDPRNRLFGHIESSSMEVDKQTQNLLAVSASMRTALLVYSGITVRMMVDTDLGAQLSTMFMVQYEPEGAAGPHDHPFEETYLILEGEVEAEFDGRRYRLGPGDVAWAGVGCVHSFTNVGSGRVRWLETQAPQPPARHSYRFARDWAYLRERLER